MSTANEIISSDVALVEKYCEALSELTQHQAGWPATLVAACILAAVGDLDARLEAIHERLDEIVGEIRERAS